METRCYLNSRGPHKTSWRTAFEPPGLEFDTCYKLMYNMSRKKVLDLTLFFFNVTGFCWHPLVPLWFHDHHSCLHGHLSCCLHDFSLTWFPGKVDVVTTHISPSGFLFCKRKLSWMFMCWFDQSPDRLTLFYEAAVPDLERAVRKRNFDDKGWESAWSIKC